MSARKKEKASASQSENDKNRLTWSSGTLSVAQIHICVHHTSQCQSYASRVSPGSRLKRSRAHPWIIDYKQNVDFFDITLPNQRAQQMLWHNMYLNSCKY